MLILSLPRLSPKQREGKDKDKHDKFHKLTTHRLLTNFFYKELHSLIFTDRISYDQFYTAVCMMADKRYPDQTGEGAFEALMKKIITSQGPSASGATVRTEIKKKKGKEKERGRKKKEAERKRRKDGKRRAEKTNTLAGR